MLHSNKKRSKIIQSMGFIFAVSFSSFQCATVCADPLHALGDNNALNPVGAGFIKGMAVRPECQNAPTTHAAPAPVPPFNWQHTGLVTIWYDDAWLSQYKVAFPLMQQFQFPGAVAVASGLVCYSAFLTWDELRTMQKAGWETTAHTVTHQCDLGYYTTATTNTELSGSKEALLKNGLHTEQFAMPCGYTKYQIASLFVGKHPPIVETAEKIYSSYRTTNYARLETIPVTDPYNIKAFQLRKNTTMAEVQQMIDLAKSKKQWLIIVVHQIDNTGRTFSITEDMLKKILEAVKASNMPVVLPSQVLAIK